MGSPLLWGLLVVCAQQLFCTFKPLYIQNAQTIPHYAPLFLKVMVVPTQILTSKAPVPIRF